MVACPLNNEAALTPKFFVTGVKDLSTGVKYMGSKVGFGFINESEASWNRGG